MAARKLAASYRLPLHHIASLIITIFILSSLSQQCSSVRLDRIFLSGAADTTQQLFHHPTSYTEKNNNTTLSIKRHQLVCFHRGGIAGPYASSIIKGRDKCCNELYISGLIKRDDRKYCLDHVAVVPDIVKGSVRPVFYLAQDNKAIFQHHSTEDDQSYKQSRQLKVFEDKEKETLSDGFQMGVGAFSPFHLTGFTTDGLDSSKKNGKELMPLEGSVEGVLSSDGGMHRSFHQKMHLSLYNLTRQQTTSGSSHQQMNINATIFLPTTESVFIDADDPLLVEYEGSSPEGIRCRASATSNNNMIQTRTSKCNIEFVHPETIDIEQPSFSSRQYIVAYQVNAMLDLMFAPITTEGAREEELEIVVDYGTTLHIRYPPPISTTNNADGRGLVPIVIQQPVLYSASASCFEGENRESEATYYKLRTTSATTTFNNIPPEPIIINVAAGLEGDYWWVTIVTMSSALLGGLMLIKSLDTVSKWC